jgi:hypothetical protein
MSEHGPNSSDRRRDLLLAIAREVVRRADRQGHEPGSVAGRILSAWLAEEGALARADHEFGADDRTGVEALAFVVSEGGALSGGLILRLPDELPDSFESVALELGAHPEPSEVRRAFFAMARSRQSRQVGEIPSPANAPLTGGAESCSGRATWEPTAHLDTKREEDST